MRVAGDDDLETRCCGIDVDVFDDVAQVDESSADVDDFGQWQTLAEVSAVDVATNDNNRGDLAQFLEDGRTIYIACVQDERGTFEVFDLLGTEQAVRVGDDRDPGALGEVVASHGRKRGVE